MKAEEKPAAEAVVDQVVERLETVQDQVSGLGETLKSLIEEHPIKAAVATFSIGFILGGLLIRR